MPQRVPFLIIVGHLHIQASSQLPAIQAKVTFWTETICALGMLPDALRLNSWTRQGFVNAMHGHGLGFGVRLFY